MKCHDMYTDHTTLARQMLEGKPADVAAKLQYHLDTMKDIDFRYSYSDASDAMQRFGAEQDRAFEAFKAELETLTVNA